MPEVYTHGHHESVLRSHKWRTAENSAAYLLPHLAEDARVLDVGCGPGTISAGLADRVPRGHVTGWRTWAADEDGWFLVPHGEILCRVS
jgi:SAM-dependent methyltransferase